MTRLTEKQLQRKIFLTGAGFPDWSHELKAVADLAEEQARRTRIEVETNLRICAERAKATNELLEKARATVAACDQHDELRRQLIQRLNQKYRI